MEDGYIKFKTVWEKKDLPDLPQLAVLQFWRQDMYRLGLIGAYDDEVGFGNISCRLDARGSFLITGSATGKIPKLGSGHFTVVADFDLKKNTVWCEGPICASSESMSHAVVYQNCPTVGGVIHAHQPVLWNFLLKALPGTSESAEYGSPEMAQSIIDLLENSNLRQEKIFAMQGHPEGVFSFGKNLEEAADILKKWMAKAGLLFT